MTLLDAALGLAETGLSVLPVTPDGSKSPAKNWKDYQTKAPTQAELQAWFTPGTYDGVGVITGAVSGNLEMFEIEGRAIHLTGQLAQLMADNGFGDLWQRLCNGYLEQSPSGGLHWLYRVDGPARPNTKLAKRPATPEELALHKATETAKAIDSLTGEMLDKRLARIDAMTPEQLPQVLIETRGEGGFTVTAPSNGRTHPTGKPWQLLAGSPTTIPTLTVDERDALYVLASTFDTMPTIEAPTTPAPKGTTPGVRPGDDFNQRATWDDILIPHGWTRGKSFGNNCFGWVRPGKQLRDGISATTGRNDGDNLYVFSTSTEFDTEKAYSKFAAYTLLEHAGDWSKAAKALAADGYGQEPHRDVTTPDTPFGAVGNLATVTQLEPRPQLQVVPERTLTHSDDANALALVDTYGDVLRYCPDRGRWYAWDGHVWDECPRSAGPAREYAKRVARALPETDPKDIAHKKKSLSAVGITAMLTQAASDNRVAVAYTDLDAHPYELNTPGGIVDLRTGQLHPADPAKLHTRSSSCTPDPTADKTVWLNFLDTTFGGDQALIDYLQRLVGYSAIGSVGSHVLPYCHGSGGNGKGVFLEANIKVLGGYATTAPAGFLMAKAHPSHETEIARLAGARMVLCSEVNDDDRFDEAKVKQLTGGDTLTARFMQQDHFTFTPSHQLWAMGNHKPHVRAGGRSFWRRLRLIPFQYEVPEDQVIDDLQGILATEHGPAILSWIIDGAVAYCRNGLQEPESVKVATGEYAHDQDTVARFLDEMCHVGGGENVTYKASLIRSAYESWCHETGDEPVSAKAFGMALRRHGIEPRRTKTARMYVGVALISDDHNASPDEPPSDPWWDK